MTTKNKKQINTRKKKREEKQHCQHRPTTPSNKRRTAVFKQPNRQPSTPSSNNPFKQPHSNNPFQTTHFKQPITKTHYKNPFKQPITKTHSNRENGSVQTTQPSTRRHTYFLRILSAMAFCASVSQGLSFNLWSSSSVFLFRM
jgi:hypothetical protein